MKSFGEIVEQHGGTVLRVCRVIVGVHDAEEAWSETFLAAMRAYPDLPDDAGAEAWLVSIAHRTATGVLRARRQEPAPDGPLPELPTVPGAPGQEGGDLRRLRDRLSIAAEAEGLLDVAYTTIDSPVGTLLLAATARGLVRVAFDVKDHDRVLETLSQRIGPRVLRAPRRLDAAARELGDYFGRKRQAFDLPLDLSLSAGFRQQVQRRLPEIGYGQTRTYGQVAALVGNRKAIRAVGTACATNPLPVVVPCHRVLRADGTPGGYVGGPNARKALLSLEAAA